MAPLYGSHSRLPPRDTGYQTPDYRDQAPDYRDQAPDYRDQAPDYRDQGPDYRDQGPDYRDQGPDFRDQGPDYRSPEDAEHHRDPLGRKSPFDDRDLPFGDDQTDPYGGGGQERGPSPTLSRGRQHEPPYAGNDAPDERDWQAPLGTRPEDGSMPMFGGPLGGSQPMGLNTLSRGE